MGELLTDCIRGGRAFFRDIGVIGGHTLRPHFLMAEHAITPAIIPKTYAELRHAVEDALLKGQRAVERAKVHTYWETGRLIKEHLLFNAARAEYGAQVIPRLARDLGADKRTLYDCLKFARLFPIVSGRSQLTWAYYRKLIQVADPAQRRALMAATLKQDWTSDDLAARVVQWNATGDDVETEARAMALEPQSLLTPQRGRQGVYRVAKIEGTLVVDLGFACYFDLPADTDFEPGALVSLDAAGRVSVAPDATKADLFNYRVELIKVVDGDTFWVKIYLRPRQWLKQKLRLRGLDCPEMKTPEGKAAKRFVDSLVGKTTAFTINTTKPDKYDRYLADVFLTTDSGEIFLNNTLLENGQAVQKEKWEFGDWEPSFAKVS